MQCQLLYLLPSLLFVAILNTEEWQFTSGPKFCLCKCISQALLAAGVEDEKRVHDCKKLSRFVQVIEELLLQHNYRQIIYLGDGRGDYCPCTRLGPNDHILARQNYPDGSECSLLQLLMEQGVPIKDCRQRLSPSQTPGLTGEASQQENEAFANTAETSAVSFAKSCQQQSDAADVDGARCQGIHAADDQSPETEQQSRLPSLPLGEKAKDSLQRQHASAYSWSAAADAANLIQVLLTAPTQT